MTFCIYVMTWLTANLKKANFRLMFAKPQRYMVFVGHI